MRFAIRKRGGRRLILAPGGAAATPDRPRIDNASYVSRILRLTLLAPDIVEAILYGKHAPKVMLATLMQPPPPTGCANGHSGSLLSTRTEETDTPDKYGEGAPRYLAVSQHRSSSPLPPAAAFVRLLHLLQFALKPRHQIFGSLQSASFIEDLGLGLDNSLLRRLVLPANMIYLLLQVATINNLTVQGGFKCISFALQFCSLGLGNRELLAQRVVGIAGRLQLP